VLKITDASVAADMQLDAFQVLIGLRLSIVRRAADMLVLHFGEIRPHASGEGTIGAYALHAQCPWRFDGPAGTVTGSGDLGVYAGPGERPPNWSYEDGLSLQDRKFGDLFARDESTRSWVNQSDRFLVIAAQQTERGDVTLELANGYAILVFPASGKSEAWRLFAPDSDRHLVFPTTARDFAISRRKRVAANGEWEAWLKVVEAPKTGSAMQAPPPVILAADGTRYRCGRCGTVLVIAEFGALRGFVVHCGNCGRYNEVPL
jgi:hypothetical protein